MCLGMMGIVVAMYSGFLSFVCIYLSVRAMYAWIICECVHKGFVCVLKGLVILLCHFWDVMIDELGGTACVCIFNVCG